MRKPRHTKSTGAMSYQAYLDRLRTPGTAPAAPRQFNEKIFVATCSGSRHLGESLGLPLAYIGVAADPCLILEGLSNARYGSLLPTGIGRAFKGEDGWDSWKVLHLTPDMAGGIDFSSLARLDRGVIDVRFGAVVSHVGLRMTLAASLRHRRFHDIASEGDATLKRISWGGPAFVSPRYTAVISHDGVSYQRVDDLYVFDPWKDFGKLIFLVEAMLISLTT